MKLPLNDILIRPDRIRKAFDPKALDELAESIRTVGLIQPIVIEDDNYLVAGERRLRACKSLGWTEVDVVYKSDLDDWTRAVIELEENLRREDLTYVEEVMAKRRIHELYQERHGESNRFGGRGHNEGWNIKDTAELLGISAGAVSQDIQLAKAIEKDPTLGKQKTKIAARSAMQRQQALTARTLLAALTPNATNTQLTQSSTNHTSTTDTIQLIHADCLDVITSMPDNSIHCLLTDPPWQVDFDSSFGSDPNVGLGLATDMLTRLYPKLHDGALCWMFCASKHLMKGLIYDMVLSCGYFISNNMFIWYKPTVAHSSSPYRELKPDFETAIVFSKSTARDLTHPMFSVFMTKLKGHKLHPAQKPVDMLRAIIEASTVQGETVIDPFMGSGSTMVACKQLDRRGIGIEMSDMWFKLAESEIALSAQPTPA